MPRRLTVRDTFSEAWKLYQLLFGRSVLTAAAVFAPIALVEFTAGEVEGTAAVAVAVLFAAVFGLLGDLLVQGALVEVVRDVHEARPPSAIGTLYERTRPRIGALLLGTIVYSLAVVFGLLLLIVPGLLALSRWSLIVPVIVIEGKGSREARKRSSSLVRGQTGRVLWIILVALLVTGLTAALISSSLFWMPTVLGGLLAGLAAAALTTPFEAHVLTVLYYRLTEPEQPVVPPAAKRWKTIWDEEGDEHAPLSGALPDRGTVPRRCSPVPS